MIKKTLKKQYKISLLLLFVVVILGIALAVIIRRSDNQETRIDGGWRFSGELDPDVKKLSEINMNFLSNYEIQLEEYSYYNRNGVYRIEDPEVVERVIGNLDSLYVRECNPNPYIEEQTRGLQVGAQSKDGSQVSCDMEILGKNEEGNYVLSLASYNEVVVEVVEGDLDYEYLKELYEKEVKENGGALEGEVVD